MISRPVCLCAENADLLEQGLRVFPGLALYDGTWEQPTRSCITGRENTVWCACKKNPLAGNKIRTRYV